MATNIFYEASEPIAVIYGAHMVDFRSLCHR